MGNLVNLRRAGDRSLQFLILNEEFLVSASHQLALITSLPFVHTARRYYRLKGLVRCPDCASGGRKSCRGSKKPTELIFVRGSKSRVVGIGGCGSELTRGWVLSSSTPRRSRVLSPSCGILWLNQPPCQYGLTPRLAVTLGYVTS